MKINIEKIFKIITKSVLYKIYIEGLYFKIMLLFLSGIFFVNNPFLLLAFGITFLLFNGAIEKNINFIKSTGIFIGLWLYVLYISIQNSFFVLLTINIIVGFIYYTLIFLSYIFKILFKIIKYLFLICIFSLFLILGLTLLGDLGPIIEPTYIFGKSNSDIAISFLGKLTGIYLIILAIYSISYYILRKNINNVINNKVDNLFNIKSLQDKNIYEKEFDDLILKRKKIKHNIFILELSYVLKYKIIYYFIFLYIITFIVNNLLLLIFK